MLSMNLYALKIDDLKFDKIIKKNETQKKEFILTNNEVDEKIYRLTIENDKNVKVLPNIIQLKSYESKKIQIQVKGSEGKGDRNYYLVIKEIQKTKQNKININKSVKIKQTYKIK